jgi:putative FmdB family regulatory protein
MPLYEYTCHDCGQIFEKMVRFTEPDQAQLCPACGSEHTLKQLSTFATHGLLSQGIDDSSASSCSSSSRFS